MKNKKRVKSKLESLTFDEIESITNTAKRKKNIPLIKNKSNQINMRIDAKHLAQAKKLAALQGIPYTTFLNKLLCEDLERLWTVVEANHKKAA